MGRSTHCCCWRHLRCTRLLGSTCSTQVSHPAAKALCQMERVSLSHHSFASIDSARFTSYLVVCFVAGMLYYSLNVIWPRQSALLWVPANDLIVRGVYANMVSFGTMLAGWYCIGKALSDRDRRIMLKFARRHALDQTRTSTIDRIDRHSDCSYWINGISRYQ